MRNTILISILISVLIILSCKKETTEEVQTETNEIQYVLKLRNNSSSEHVIQMFQTRSGNDFADVEEKEWSENHLGLANFIPPGDSMFINFNNWKNSYIEFRLGVITPQGTIVNLDEQEGYTIGYYQHFNWTAEDTVELALTIVTDNSGYIYFWDF